MVQKSKWLCLPCGMDMKGLHACLLGFSGSRLRICSSWRQIRLIIRFLPGTLIVALWILDTV